MTEYWRLDSQHQTLVFRSADKMVPSIIYWGVRLADDEDLAALSALGALDVTGGMIDANPELSICPLASRSFPGQPGLMLRDADGKTLHPALVLSTADVSANQAVFHCSDASSGLEYRATFQLHSDQEVIVCWSEIESQQPVILHHLAAPVFPGSQYSDEFWDFAGRWVGEFQVVKNHWQPGVRLRENLTGRTGHEHFPGLIVKGDGASETAGEVFGFHYGWSGGHRMVAEELPDGRRQIQFAHASGIELSPVMSAKTAPLYATYSNVGVNGVATRFQHWVRQNIVTFSSRHGFRPVHYNCWEAVYFDHKVEELQDIASRAKALGAERFVLDDGWFKNRSIDDRALGDWTVDAGKYPDGLHPLVNHIKSLDMTFGIWFEPEMVNLDSDLARQHPDWILGADDQIPGRQQYVLDLSNAAVLDYLYGAIADILSTYDVDYIKWDHNRVLPTPDAAQTRGIYTLLDRLRANFTNVEIESCSSGGGRIDYGILQRTQRVWLSDSNDAIERLKIQHNAALFLPACVTGSHVGPRLCHTSGRQIDISMRSWVAAQRHMGFEMDPRELTDHEAAVLTRVTQWWKDNRSWMYSADIHRLERTDPAIIAEVQVSNDQEHFVLFAGKVDTSGQILPRPLRLTGLDPNSCYRIALVNRDEANHLSRGQQLLKSDSLVVSGRALMNQGIALPWSFQDVLWVVQGQRLDD